MRYILDTLRNEIDAARQEWRRMDKADAAEEIGGFLFVISLILALLAM